MIEVLLAVSLLHKIVAAEAQQNAMRLQYECRELQENWDAGNKDASLRTKLYDVILLEGLRYRKLIFRNGEPLSSDERRLVDDDMLRTSVLRQAVVDKPTGEPLATLGRTHNLTLAAPNQLIATPRTTGRSYRLTYDPTSFAILEYVREDGDMKLTIEYTNEPDSPHLMRRMEVLFTAGIPRVQQSTFSDYRRAQ